MGTSTFTTQKEKGEKQMKNSTIALLLMTLIFCLPVMAGDQVLTNNEGQILIQKDESWRTLTPEEQKAYTHPGEKVPVLAEKFLERAGFFFGATVQVAHKSVVYTGKEFNYVLDDTFLRSDTQFLWYKVVLLVATIFASLRLYYLLTDSEGTGFMAFHLIALMGTFAGLGLMSYFFTQTQMSILALSLFISFVTFIMSFAVVLFCSERAFKIMNFASLGLLYITLGFAVYI